jgi:hypothetical protein
MTRRRQGPKERPSDVAEEHPSDVAGQGSEELPYDVEGEVNKVRFLVARARVMGTATEAMIEVGPWGDDPVEDRHRLEDLSHLVSATVEALRAAMVFGDQLAVRLAKLTSTRIAAALAKLSTRPEERSSHVAQR